ncbi:N-acetyl-gamma-glutamyl-phosphate reductase [Marinobacter nanhaiticus D15-8W]|nr:N-acetyl-gamma-glutamyl-phosphate reductase [Marinobacter nanhaiticus D15-8W]
MLDLRLVSGAWTRIVTCLLSRRTPDLATREHEEDGTLIKVGIVGGTGYTGVELLRILATHPQAEVTMITSRSEAGQPVADMYPNLRGYFDLEFTEPDEERLAACDLVFFATPHGVAMRTAPKLIAAGTRVVDLSADFRIRDLDVWAAWYGMPHESVEWAEKAVYGLPEVFRDQIRDAKLVANPGCYPTAVQLGFLPLLEKGLVDPSRLIADAKSGASGAGRQGKIGMLHGEIGESFKAYGASGHRHLPEIRQGLEIAAGGRVGVTFVPHLLPMIRGIEATLYAEVRDPAIFDTLQSLYEERFANEPFVDVMPYGAHPETRSVRGANHCRMALHRQENSPVVIVSSVIDNLVKGAAGQAVQNMNIMFGIDETAGLDAPALLP